MRVAATYCLSRGIAISLANRRSDRAEQLRPIEGEGLSGTGWLPDESLRLEHGQGRTSTRELSPSTPQ